MRILAILAAVLLLGGCYATVPANETPAQRAARMQSSQMLFNAGMRILQMNQPRPAMPMQYRALTPRQTTCRPISASLMGGGYSGWRCY